MISIGIDVGKKGAIVIIDSKGQLIEKHKVPQIGTATDYRALCALLEKYKDKYCTIYLEDVHSIFGAGAKSNFSFGSIKGFKMGVAYALQMRLELVQPKTWQKAVWTPSDKVYKPGTKKINTKQTSLIAAKRLFPKEDFLASARSKVPHDGIVDASLIAYYGYTRTKQDGTEEH